MKRSAWFLVPLLFALRAGAADVADCQGVTDGGGKSKQIFDGKVLMVGLALLEKQGEAKFHPAYPEPASACALARFDAAGAPVTAIYSPFEKGDQTLLFRFVTTGADETRTVLVLFDGMASLVYDKMVFTVVEERKGNISYYAMFNKQPTYVTLQPLVASIVDGTAKPLAIVRWPPGAKEPVIDAFDSKRLKN